MKRLRHILLLTLLVFSALWVAGQPAVPDTVCVGTTKKYWVTGSAGSTYTWRIDGVIQPSVIDTLNVTWNSPWVPSATPYVVTVQEQTLQGCVGEVMSSVVVVRESLPVSVDILAGLNPVCTGIEVTFTALPVNGGTGPVFSWFVNGIEMLTGPSPTYSYTPADGDLVYVALASSEACAANSPAISSTITMVVSPLLLVEVSVTPDADPVCAGTMVTYTASPVNGGLTPVFSWFVNGVLVQNGLGNSYSYVPAEGDQLYVSLTSDAVCTLNPTVNSDLLIIHVLPLAAPVFDAIGPLCQNSTPPMLPGTSLNGISGNWDPAFIDTGIPGTFSFTFTPDGGQCAEAVSLSVTIEAEVQPQFDAIPSLCINSVPPLLEGTSLNGITGSWDPAVISTGIAGTTTYTFTPDAGQCATAYYADVTVTEEVTPLFDPFGLLCTNSIPPALPDVSVNGISGTWDPPVIGTGLAGTFTFTFTPNAGECAVGTSVDITVSPEIYPQFDLIGPLCLNSIPPSLSLISINNITGSWDPAVINTGAIGTTTYTFVPDNGQCAIEYRMDIEVTDQILPLFDPVGPLCLNSTAPLLPPASVNGITGTWNPATINTGALGTFNFIFTPDGGQCGIETSLEITVTDQILPVFDPVGPLCLNSTPPALPGTSLNGITGAWFPATINTGAIGTTTYVFTPDGGQCGIETTLEVIITGEILPTFDPVGPLCLNAAAPALPAASLEGITGSWIPATVNTGTIGFTTYTFTPDPGQCAVPAGNTLVVEITDGILPLFDVQPPVCQNTTPPELPAVSNNGITGTWFPATINTAVPGTTTHTFTPDAGQCGLTTTLDITVTDEITPLFTLIGPLCVNSTPPVLPQVSENGLTGTWSPAAINTGAIGTTIYTFTPDFGQCGVTTTMEITVTGEIMPLFDPMGPYCFNTTAPALPATALNGITGTWVPAAINTLFIGTTTYVFTPDDGQCAVGTTLDITVTDELIPQFVPIGPLCLNSTPPVLPLTSDNGLTGTWSPATINTGATGTTTYTFTPDAGQCGAVVTMDITITDELIPQFVPIGPLCLNSTPPVLPLTSDNGLTGTWSPATINTGATGTTTYTFTPDAGQCGAVVTMDITITYELIPQFVPIGPLCLNSTPPVLPLTSDNGLTGAWSPATINTGATGTTTYTFTPDAGQCGAVVTMDITITDQIIPQFVPIGPLCLNSAPPALPLISENGISGTWNPALISTIVAGTAAYTFTPDVASVCAVSLEMTIEISSPEITSPPDITHATNGQANGSVIIHAGGNGLEYSYDGGLNWTGNNTNSGLFPGDYTALIRDVNLCQVSMDYRIDNLIQGTVYLTADNDTSCMGAPVPVPVFVEGFSGVASFGLQMNYDPLRLGFAGYNQVNAGLLNGTLTITGPISGFIEITWTGNTPSNILSGEKLFDLVFNTLSPGTATLQWLDPICEFYAADSYPMMGVYVNGSAIIKPSPRVVLSGGGVYCEGDSTTLSAISVDGQLLDYLWSGPGGTAQAAREWEIPELTQDNSGIYTLYSGNVQECSDTKTLSLEVNPKPVFSIAQSDSLCAGTFHQLDAGSGYESYLWQDGSLLQTLMVKDAGQYTVEVVNAYGCTGESSVWLVPCSLEITIPTAFTPDENNLNDVFRPVIEGDIQPSGFHMLIYNKWGELIYETADYGAGWDGSFHGSPAPRGIYVYVINFEVPGYINTTLNSPVRGTVTLLR
ncbi:MAG: gliding motility-associated C-terminal domain-containing protein [Bacteroidota bacterium]